MASEMGPMPSGFLSRLRQLRRAAQSLIFERCHCSSSEASVGTRRQLPRARRLFGLRATRLGFTASSARTVRISMPLMHRRIGGMMAGFMPTRRLREVECPLGFSKRTMIYDAPSHRELSSDLHVDDRRVVFLHPDHRRPDRALKIGKEGGSKCCAASSR